MTIIEIETYLKIKTDTLNQKILDNLETYLKKYQKEEKEEEANYCWCLKQIYTVKKEYLTAYHELKHHDFENAWYNLGRADIELSFFKIILI